MTFLWDKGQKRVNFWVTGWWRIPYRHTHKNCQCEFQNPIISSGDKRRLPFGNQPENVGNTMVSPRKCQFGVPSKTWNTLPLGQHFLANKGQSMV